jgi:hypothetical protein
VSLFLWPGSVNSGALPGVTDPAYRKPESDMSSRPMLCLILATLCGPARGDVLPLVPDPAAVLAALKQHVRAVDPSYATPGPDEKQRYDR